MKSIKFIKAGGEIRSKEILLADLESSFKTLANGEYAITISKLEKKRTIEQNRLMWLWFACIEQETGTDKNDIHDYYCGRFITRTIIVNGKSEIVTTGTSKLNTIGMADFLNKVQSDAASEFGIGLPNPDDINFAEFKEYYKNFINTT